MNEVLKLNEVDILLCHGWSVYYLEFIENGKVKKVTLTFNMKNNVQLGKKSLINNIKGFKLLGSKKRQVFHLWILYKGEMIRLKKKIRHNLFEIITSRENPVFSPYWGKFPSF